MEDSGRESQVKSSMLCKSLGGWLSVLITSIEGEDFTVVCVGSRFNVVAPTVILT